mmetsp:Transcript_35976/g.111774  ORF Transcript_35976/g.111774 Transcript_35976/m.111774 type:complete len:279 (-) Transcript_35976:473-1309(-)
MGLRGQQRQLHSLRGCAPRWQDGRLPSRHGPAQGQRHRQREGFPGKGHRQREGCRGVRGSRGGLQPGVRPGPIAEGGASTGEHCDTKDHARPLGPLPTGAGRAGPRSQVGRMGQPHWTQRAAVLAPPLPGPAAVGAAVCHRTRRQQQQRAARGARLIHFAAGDGTRSDAQQQLIRGRARRCGALPEAAVPALAGGRQRGGRVPRSRCRARHAGGHAGGHAASADAGLPCRAAAAAAAAGSAGSISAGPADGISRESQGRPHGGPDRRQFRHSVGQAES